MKLSELQSHIKEFDYAPEQSGHYFLKLIEEVGELSESIRNGKSGQPTLDELKGSIAEELYDVLYYVCALANILYDVLYYVCALANIHGVNLEKTHELKEVLNKVKYNR
ncbi:MazG nucleotide pyrophosphohydrolase domain-containing protein [Vibrio parahaemolyticus]|uniref:MazG nucleotide pyrophosphohydrolase domain-containing protein n=4 Tax=Vibrio parahaemolyticus TaxID=670 RepID=UPI003892B0F2